MNKKYSSLTTSLSIAFFIIFSFGLLKTSENLLFGRNKANNAVVFDEKTGQYLGIFIPPDLAGVAKPEDLLFGPDGDIYISSGDTAENSAILRYDGKTGAYKGIFASGNGLIRPYGLAFGPDGYLYVSSFKSDRILRFDGRTGQFIDEFASSNGSPDGLNGPNNLIFTEDGTLYVSTKGTVRGEKKANFPSQILKFQAGEKQSIVFAQQSSNSSGSFASLLELALNSQKDLLDRDFNDDLQHSDLKKEDSSATIYQKYINTSFENKSTDNFTFDPNRLIYTVDFDRK
jgi:outer membrane protein assembly factor BamB